MPADLNYLLQARRNRYAQPAGGGAGASSNEDPRAAVEEEAFLAEKKRLAQAAKEQEAASEAAAKAYEKGRKEAEKEALRARNNEMEARARREKRPIYTDANGVIQSQYTDEEWQAKKEQKARNDALRTQYFKENRPWVEDAEGNMIPRHTDAEWETQKAEKLAKEKAKKLDEQAKAWREQKGAALTTVDDQAAQVMRGLDLEGQDLTLQHKAKLDTVKKANAQIKKLQKEIDSQTAENDQPLDAAAIAKRTEYRDKLLVERDKVQAETDAAEAKLRAHEVRKLEYSRANNEVQGWLQREKHGLKTEMPPVVMGVKGEGSLDQQGMSNDKARMTNAGAGGGTPDFTGGTDGGTDWSPLETGGSGTEAGGADRSVRAPVEKEEAVRRAVIEGRISALAEDDSISDEERKARLTKLMLQRDDPKAYEAQVMQEFEALPPEKLGETLDGHVQDFELRKQDWQSRRDALMQQTEAVNAEVDGVLARNAQRLQQPHKAADLIEYTTADGGKVSVFKDLAPQLEQAQEKAGTFEKQHQAEMDQINAEGGELERAAKLIHAGGGVLQKKQESAVVAAKAERQKVYEQLNTLPGAKLGDELAAVDAAVVKHQGGDDVSLHEWAAKEREKIVAKAEAVQKKMGTAVQAAYAAASAKMPAGVDLNGELDRDPLGLEGPATDAGVSTLLKQMYLPASKENREMAAKMLRDAAAADWSRGDTSAPVRMDSAGRVLVNPERWTDDKAYAEAVAGAGASEAEKAKALEMQPELKAQAIQLKLDTLRHLGVFRAWEEAEVAPTREEKMEALANGAKAEPRQVHADLGDEEKLKLFEKEHSGVFSTGAWKVRWNQALLGAAQGVLGLAQSATGIAGVVSDRALDLNRRLGKDNADLGAQAQALPTGQWVNQGASMLVSSAPALAVGGGVGAVTRSEALALHGAAAGAGLQTFGQVYGAAVQGFQQNQGMSQAEARKAALIPALASGASTYALTAAGGTKGMESILRTEGFKQGFKQWLKTVGKGAFQEGVLEEAPDQLIQGVLARHSYDPTKSWASIWEEAMVAGIGGALLGGGFEMMSGAGGKNGRKEAQEAGETGGGQDGQDSGISGLGMDSEPAEAGTTIPGDQSQLQTGAPSTEPEAGKGKPTLQEAQAELASFAPEGMAAHQVAATKAKAEVLLRMAQGETLADFTDEELRQVGLNRDGTPGHYESVLVDKKDPQGARTSVWKKGVRDDGFQPVVVEDGELIITQRQIDNLGVRLPAVAAQIGKSEVERRREIGAKGAPAAAAQEVEGGPSTRRQQIQARLAEIEKQYGPRADVIVGADSNPDQIRPRRATTTEEAALLKEVEGINAAENSNSAPTSPADNGVSIDNLDGLLANGGGVVQVSQNGRKVAYDKFGLSIDGNTAEVAFVELATAERGKGIGYDAYIALGKALAAKGITLQSSKSQYGAGRKLWEKLAAQGLATKGAQGVYSFTAPAEQSTSSTTTPAFQNVVHDTPAIQIGKANPEDHVTEAGYAYRTMSAAELADMHKAGELRANPTGKSRGGRKNVKHWDKGGGGRFYRKGMGGVVVRVPLSKIQAGKPVSAQDVEVMNTHDWTTTKPAGKPIAKDEGTGRVVTPAVEPEAGSPDTLKREQPTAGDLNQNQSQLQTGAPSTETPAVAFDPVVEQRVDEIGAELAGRGLSGEQALKAARGVVGRMGVMGPKYEVQMIDPAFEEAMKAEGFQRDPAKMSRWMAKGQFKAETRGEKPVMRKAEAGTKDALISGKGMGEQGNAGAQNQSGQDGQDSGISGLGTPEPEPPKGGTTLLPEGGGRSQSQSQLQTGAPSTEAGRSARAPLIERSDWKQAQGEVIGGMQSRAKGLPEAGKKAAADKIKAVVKRFNKLEELIDTKFGRLFEGVRIVPNGSLGGSGVAVQVAGYDGQGRATGVELLVDAESFAAGGGVTDGELERALNEEWQHRADLMVMSRSEAIALARDIHAAQPGVFNAAWKQYFAVDIQKGGVPAKPPVELTDDEAYMMYFEASRMIRQGTFTSENAAIRDVGLLQRMYLMLSRYVNFVRREMKKLPQDLRELWEDKLTAAEAVMGKTKAAGIRLQKEHLDDVEPPEELPQKGAKTRKKEEPVDEDEAALAMAADAEMDVRPERQGALRNPGENAIRGMAAIPDPDTGKENVVVWINRYHGRITRPSQGWLARMAQDGKDRSKIGDWDDIQQAEIPSFYAGLVFKNGNGSTLDQALQELHGEGYFPGVAAEDVTGEMLARKIKNVIQRYQGKKQGGATTVQDEEQAHFERMEKQRVEFERSTAKGPIYVKPHEMQPGDVMMVKADDGKMHRVEVLRLDTEPVPAGEEFDPDANPAQFLGPDGPMEIRSVTLKDGTTFGVQTIDGQQGLYVDAFSVRQEGDFYAGLSDAVRNRTIDDADAVLRVMQHEGMDATTPFSQIVLAIQQNLRVPMKRAQKMLGQVMDTDANATVWTNEELKAALESPLGSPRKQAGGFTAGLQDALRSAAAVKGAVSPAPDLAQAYAIAQKGASGSMLPISRVFKAAQALQPGLTPQAFLEAVKAADEAGTVLLGAYDSPKQLQDAGEFTVRNAAGIPSVDMMVVDSSALASARKQGQGGSMADPDKAAQNAEPSPGGLSEAEVKSLVSEKDLSSFEEDYAEEPGLMKGKFWMVEPWSYKAASNYTHYVNAVGDRLNIRISDHEKPVGHITDTDFEFSFVGDKRSGVKWLRDTIKADGLAITSLADAQNRLFAIQSELQQRRLKDQADFARGNIKVKGLLGRMEERMRRSVSQSTPRQRLEYRFWSQQLELAKKQHPADVLTGEGVGEAEGRGQQGVGSVKTSTEVEDKTYAIPKVGQNPVTTQNGSQDYTTPLYNGPEGNASVSPSTPKINPEKNSANYGLSDSITSNALPDTFQDSKRTGPTSERFERFGGGLFQGQSPTSSGGKIKTGANAGKASQKSGGFVLNSGNPESSRAEGGTLASSKKQSDRSVRAPVETIDEAAHEAATSPRNDLPEPTEAQKEAGNYAMGHAVVGGHEISIENPAGSKRRPEWPVLRDHYGYLKGTVGQDGDHVDVFVKPGTPADYAGPVHVVRQNVVEHGQATGKLDEYKVMLGYPTAEEARAAYLRNYTKGWPGLAKLTTHTMPEFEVIKQSVFGGDVGARATDKALASAQKQVQDGAMADPDKAAQNAEPSPGGLSEVEARNPMTIYRAGDADEIGVKPWASFTPERKTAESYTDNPGFGGEHVRELRVDAGNVLDLTGGDPWKKLADALGYDSETAQQWHDNGWKYPWEESSNVKRSLQDSEYDAVKYTDDFPAGATTIIFTREPQYVKSPVAEDSVSRGSAGAGEFNSNGAATGPFSAADADPSRVGNANRNSLAVNPESSRAEGGTLAAPRKQSKPLEMMAKADWGRIDKALTGRLAAAVTDAAAWIKKQALPGEAQVNPVDAALEMLAGWSVAGQMEASGATFKPVQKQELMDQTRRQLRRVWNMAVRQLVPDASLPADVLAKKREMTMNQALSNEVALDIGKRALAGKPKLSDLVVGEAQQNPEIRRKMFLAMNPKIDSGVTMESLNPEERRVAEALLKLRDDLGRRMVKAGRIGLQTYEAMREGTSHYYDHDVKKEKSLLRQMSLGLRNLFAQTATAFHIVDTQTKQPDGSPALVMHPGSRNRPTYRFDTQQQMRAWYEEFIKDQTLQAAEKGNAGRYPWMTPADKAALAGVTRDGLNNPGRLSAEQRAVVSRLQEQLRARFEKRVPLSYDEHSKAGLIEDPFYSVARQIAEMGHDVATAEFFNYIAGVPDYVRDAPTIGYTEMPDTAKLGALAGKYVRDDVAAEVQQLTELPGLGMKFYDALLGLFKTGKTVLNPGSHGRNIVGNIAFAHLAGSNPLNPGNATYYAEALRVLREGGADYREMYENGVLGGDFLTGEVKRSLRQLVPDAATVLREAESGNLTWLYGLKEHMARRWQGLLKTPGKALDIAATAWRLEDDIYKAAAYLKAKGMGMTSKEAAEHVREWFPYYDKGTSGTLKFLGRFAFPFLSFKRESFRILKNGLTKKPLATITTLALPRLLTQIALTMAEMRLLMWTLGLGLKDERDKEDVLKVLKGRAGRLLSPIAGDTSLFSILLPWRDGNGGLQQWDLSNTHPFGDWLATRIEDAESKEPWIARQARELLTGSPFVSLLVESAMNKDSFTGRRIYEDDMSSSEATDKLLEHAYTELAPPIAPTIPLPGGVKLEGTSARTIRKAFEQSPSKLAPARNPTQAVIRAVLGLDVRPADPNLYDDVAKYREKNKLPAVPRGQQFPSDAVGRARAELYRLLIQPEVDVPAVKAQLEVLTKHGAKIPSVQDLFKDRQPQDVMKLKKHQARWMNQLAPEAKRVLEAAQQQQSGAKPKALDAMAKARAGG